jgi:Ser/Thr protein kinase RdoA (MazF antagonist)
LNENRSLAGSEENPSLIHGDFEIRNIRVKRINNCWKICSILDFEYAASESKEYDFIKLHRFGLFEKENLKKSFLKGYSLYQSIPQDLEEKVKFMRITRDIGFAGVLFKSGNIDLGNKILSYVEKEISKTIPSSQRT